MKYIYKSNFHLFSIYNIILVIEIVIYTILLTHYLFLFLPNPKILIESGYFRKDEILIGDKEFE